MGSFTLRGIVGFGRLALCLASGLLVAGNPASAETYRLLELEGRDAVRWRMPAEGAPAKITYAFLAAPASFEGARNCGGMLPPGTALGPSHIREDDFRREVRAAFTVWEQAANIVFEETSSTADAGILIGADAKPRGRAFTNVALATSEPRSSDSSGNRGVGDIRQSLICLNPHQPWKIGFDGNLDIYDLRFTMTHEIGHAIGLDHPGPERPADVVPLCREIAGPSTGRYRWRGGSVRSQGIGPQPANPVRLRAFDGDGDNATD